MNPVEALFKKNIKSLFYFLFFLNGREEEEKQLHTTNIQKKVEGPQSPASFD